MNAHVQEWLDISREDYDAAEVMFENRKYLYSVFMCQQAVEKAMKALYQHKFTEVPPRKHDLVRLADEAGVLGECSDEQKVFLSTLTEFYIEARYPGDRAELSIRCDRDFARTILDGTREMVVWLRNQLKDS